jgi:hypothetical protein
MATTKKMVAEATPAKKPPATPRTVPPVPRDHEWIAFQGRFKQTYDRIVGDKQALFTTDADPEIIWKAYLATIPDDTRRQHNNCNCCRRFVQRYGGLVTVDEKGEQRSALWHESDAPNEIMAGIRSLRVAAEKALITGVFVSDEKVWGSPQTKDGVRSGYWTHLALDPGPGRVWSNRVVTATAQAAIHLENHKHLGVALKEFKQEYIDQALAILRAEALSDSAKFIAVAEWLSARQGETRLRGRAGRNLIWRAVASAPAGFCTPRSSMIGSLIEDLASGMPFQDVKKRFDAKMHPLKYKRPTAAPAAGNIKVAEEIIAKLGLEPSLRRRFATMSDVLTVWKPRSFTEKPRDSSGVFGGLTPKASSPSQASRGMVLPDQTMTWVKFRDNFLGSAEKIEMLVPTGNDSFAAMVTASDPSAPPLLLWDNEEQRNPVNWYLYHGGSPASRWGLRARSYTEVVGISTKPNTWHGDKWEQEGQGLIFILKGARDGASNTLALFPDTLRGELHGIRSTIEAYSNKGKIEMPWPGEQLASGLMVAKTQKWSVTLRVTSKGAVSNFTLDRWD